MTRHAGFAVWLTGLPASGKSTLARGLAARLRERGRPVQILDSDELRAVLTPEPTYTVEERDRFYQAVAFIARLLTQNGVTVLIAATANERRFRRYAEKRIEAFAQVYVRCSLETCMDRDQKGIYEKALRGEATTMPGLQVPYEPPTQPLTTIDTEKMTPEEGVQQVLDALTDHSFLGR